MPATSPQTAVTETQSSQQAPAVARTSAPVDQATRPLLLLFTSQQSGVARRVEGYVAHVLQRRHNHQSFRYFVVDQDERPDLFERFHIEQIPTILVVDRRKVRRRLDGYVRPNVLESALHPWLH